MHTWLKFFKPNFGNHWLLLSIALLKVLNVDVADSSLPQVDVGLYLESFGVHGRFHRFYVKDEYSTFSTFMNDKLTLILDSATSSVEPNLQDILDIPLVTRMAESHVFNVFD